MENRVREFRIGAGMTQRELSEKSGISRTTIWSIESNKATVVNSATLIHIADALGKGVEECFFTQKVQQVKQTNDTTRTA